MAMYRLEGVAVSVLGPGDAYDFVEKTKLCSENSLILLSYSKLIQENISLLPVVVPESDEHSSMGLYQYDAHYSN